MLISNILKNKTFYNVFDSKRSSFDMLNIKCKVYLKDNKDMTLSYETDPEVYKIEKYLQNKSHITVCISSEYPDNDSFSFAADEYQKLFKGLPVFDTRKVYSLSIGVIDTMLLMQLLDLIP